MNHRSTSNTGAIHRLVRLIIPFFLSLSGYVCADKSLSPRVNNCRAAKIKFLDESGEPTSWPIYLDYHCMDRPDGYIITASNGSHSWEGLYEEYSRHNNAPTYEYILDNGTTFSLRQISDTKTCKWVLSQGQTHLYYSLCGPQPLIISKNGWTRMGGSRRKFKKQGVPVVERVEFEKPKLLSRNLYLSELMLDLPPIDEFQSVNTVDIAALRDMMHPAVSRGLGFELRNRYTSVIDRPFDSISIDNLFRTELLKKSLDFVKVPASEWVGPETAAHCCRGKYRLPFSKWMLSKWSKAVRALVYDDIFIAFLEGLTGINGLIPMHIDEEQMQWAGSNIIRVESGGLLYVHNDFNMWNGLYRRVNVLLYLNEDWQASWGGHLELWGENNTRYDHRILPIFNRVTIFSVTDDAYHGHPLPLMTPDGVYRY